MQVPLLDLKKQYDIIRPQVLEALQRVLEGQSFILGPEVQALEQNLSSYLGCKHAIGVSSGTDALLASLMAINLQPGNEVILPTYSFFATAGVVSRLQAVPVFVDVDPCTYNISVTDVERCITSRTRAIIPVHLFGQCAEMDKIMAIAEKHGLFVIEDAAQAIGAQYKDGKKAGTIAQIGCFSFFPSKNLGGYGDGGLVVTDDDEIADRLRILRVHGGRPKYHHKIVGGNFRLDTLQAAVLNVKLPYLDRWSAQRQKNAKLYNSLFVELGLASKTGMTEFDVSETVLLPAAVYEDVGHPNYHIYNQYIIRVKQRDALMQDLRKKSVGCEIYYPVPFHRQECFAYLKPDLARYASSDRCAAESLALPIYPELSVEQIHYVVDCVQESLQGRP